MRCAYYGLYGDLQNDVQIQNAGRAIADRLDAVEARERLRKLGPLKKQEDDYRLVAKEVFEFTQGQLGIDGILNYGMKEWDTDHFWAAGFFASEMWASAVQVGEFDTMPISSWTFYSPDASFDDTLSNEFAKLVDEYNSHCLSCPAGWNDHGLSTKGYHCTAGWDPNCDAHCLQSECDAIKGSRWDASVDLEYNPYTCYLSACPQGWDNLGFYEQGKMCTTARTMGCDEKCAQVQCNKVGGTFPLEIDDVSDNPYVCFV